MVKQRVCVIGGGPAGLAAALEGARLGMSVDLFESGRIGGHIRCAEGFYDSLHLLGRPSAGVRYKVEKAVLKIKREFLVDCRSIPLWMIDRAEWQTSLAQEAGQAGVNIMENHRITKDNLTSLQQAYDWVIDSSGVPCLTSIKYGFRDYYRQHSAVTVQYIIEGDFSGLGKCLKFAFLPHYTGYYWIFPKGRDSREIEAANVGIGWFPGHLPEKRGQHLWQVLDQILDEEKISGNILRRHGGLIPVRLLDRLQYGNILLVGDAAGCASPLHAGGIDTAYLTGQLAARWLNSDPDHSDGVGYTQAVKKRLAKKLKTEAEVCACWESINNETLDELAGLYLDGVRQSGFSVLWANLGVICRCLRPGLHLRSGLIDGRW
jgi:digeranylgeranylglycerophospholipid reductase